jgi:hypothetical protein
MSHSEFFASSANPGGFLTAPGSIPKDERRAERDIPRYSGERRELLVGGNGDP